MVITKSNKKQDSFLLFSYTRSFVQVKCIYIMSSIVPVHRLLLNFGKLLQSRLKVLFFRIRIDSLISALHHYPRVDSLFYLHNKRIGIIFEDVLHCYYYSVVRFLLRYCPDMVHVRSCSEAFLAASNPNA